MKLSVIALIMTLVSPIVSGQDFVSTSDFSNWTSGVQSDLGKFADKFRGLNSTVQNLLSTKTAEKDTITMNLNGSGAWIGVLPEGKDIVINAQDFSWNVNASGTAAAGSTTQKAAAAANSQVGSAAPEALAQAQVLPATLENLNPSYTQTEIEQALLEGPVLLYGDEQDGVFYPNREGKLRGVLNQDSSGRQTFSEA